ncbi:MAG: hypothetical protein ACNA7Y_05215, partial [Gammaproteobacteria bacterium]
DLGIEKLDKKIDFSLEKLDKKIDFSLEKLDKKIELLDKKIDIEIGKVRTEITLVQSNTKHMKWMFSVLVMLLVIPLFKSLFDF